MYVQRLPMDYGYVAQNLMFWTPVTCAATTS